MHGDLHDDQVLIGGVHILVALPRERPLVLYVGYDCVDLDAAQLEVNVVAHVLVSVASLALLDNLNAKHTDE
jgi:hypothetical protein